MMKYLALLAGVMVAGCQSFGTPVVNVASNQAVAVVQAFDGLEATATAYISLPVCSATVVSPCRNQAAAAAIAKAIRNGRTARAQLEALVTVSGGGAINVTSYNNLQSIVTTLEGIYSQYSIH